ncbi:MAG: hypothetical protein OEN55_06125 [Alphaproteobacteria bacterium]|nr:hypothetical protein [Alphaproteobacteria bacterium]
MWIRSIAALCVVLAVAVAGSAGAGEPKFVMQPLLDGKVMIAVPRDFELMSDDMARLKYPSERRPPIVFTDSEGTVNITVKPTAQRVTEADIDIARIFLTENFRRLYPSGNVGSTLFDLGDRTAFFISMTTPAIDTEIRSLITGAAVDGRLVLFGFNVTRELESTWIDKGAIILMTVLIFD